MFSYLKFSRFFSHVQEAGWYAEFLSPVVDSVPENCKILDIGTGSGKLLQMLSQQKSVKGVGVDTSEEMLMEAGKKLAGTDARLEKTALGEKLPFSDNSFDCITICNVLFNLDRPSSLFLLEEARRVVRQNGKIIVLSPSGTGGIRKLTKHFFSPRNWSMYIWYNATASRARAWSINNYLPEFSRTHKLKYSKETVLKGFAIMETLW
jgi:ubiquinone/menaquinone biosynthesis C-methylase UbiE